MKTLGGADGSLTIIGAVSPPAGDFSEPVTSHTKRYVRCFWGLDRERAQARFYPAIHPLQSYSENAVRFSAWWTERGNSEWHAHRERLLSLLEAQADLERMARIVGKDALPPAQQLTLAVRRAGQRSVPAPVGVLRSRPLLLAAAPDRDAQAHSALHRAGRSGA